MASPMRYATLLGKPRDIPSDDLERRRDIADGCPLTKAKAAHYGAVDDVFGEDADGGFALNVAGMVVDNLVNALNVTGAALPKGEGDGSAAEARRQRDLAWDCWKRSDLGASSQGAFTMAAVDGQAFLIVGDAGTVKEPAPTAYVHATYDGEDGLKVESVYPDGALRAAVLYERETIVLDAVTQAERSWVTALREWALSVLGRPVTSTVKTATRERRTVYEYDRATDRTAIVYYRKDEQAQAVRVDARDNPVPLDAPADLWPHGCPIVPLVSPNDGEVTGLGPQQRAVNCAALDLIAARRIDALRIGWTVNVKPIGGGASGTSPTQGARIRPGAWFQFETMASARFIGNAGQVGALNPSNLEGFRESLKLEIETMLLLGKSMIRQLPWYYNSREGSGIALHIAERPFRENIGTYKERWSGPLGQLFRTWLRMLGVAEPMNLVPAWRPLSYGTIRDQLESSLIADTARMPLEWIGEQVMGMSPDEIEAWRQNVERAKEEMIDLGIPNPMTEGTSLDALNGKVASMAGSNDQPRIDT